MRIKLARRVQPKEIDDEGGETFSPRGTLGTVADVAGILALITSGVSVLLGGSVAQAVMAATLAGLALVFMRLNYKLHRAFEKTARRARSGTSLALCHRKLRDASVALYREELSIYAILVAEAAREFAAAYSIATGHHVRVAIQDVALSEGDDQGSAEVVTLCRSFEPEHGTREHRVLTQTDLARDNTDFLDILEGAKVFFSNDLASVPNYRNSHFDTSADPSTYPYRSTIVWPIVGPALVKGEKREQIIGFLSVDSERAQTFTRHLDVPTGKAVASALYSSLSRFRVLRENGAQIQAGETDGNG